MTPESLLHTLRKQNVLIWVENDTLRFNAPKGVLDSTRLAEIARLKHDLIDHLNKTATLPALRRSRPESPSRLSFGQARIWFLTEQQPDSAAYLVRRIWRIRGDLNITVLESALRHIVERHEILRFFVDETHGEPSAGYLPVFNPLTVIENESRESKSASQILRQNLSRPMALGQGPLFRAVLVKSGAKGCLLGFTLHHIITDAWSMNVLWRELSDFYQRSLDNTGPALTPLSIQFREFSAWQHGATARELMQRQLDYWKNKLKGFKNLDLPTDHLRSETGNTSACVTFSLDENQTGALHQLARRLDATLYMVLLAALKCLLSRYSGQTDIVVGTVVSNRPFSELEKLIGFFTNTLALRTHIDSDSPFHEVVSATKTTCLEAFNHKDVPFEKLVETLKPERSMHRHPFFDVMFVMTNTAPEILDLKDVSVNREKLPPEESKFDLTVTVQKRDGQLEVDLDFRRELFNQDRIRQMGGHYLKFLASALQHPDTPVRDLSLLSGTERHRVLFEWNKTQLDIPADSTVHNLFEACVERNPERIALRSGQESLSYVDLDRRANQLARYLVEQGTKSGERVGLLIERSIDCVVSILAILKAGAAFVPLEVDAPVARVAFMVEDSNIRRVVTRSADVENHAALPCEFIVLDAISRSLNGFSRDPLQGSRDWRRLAYIIYTSGSTGRPKGAQIEHRSIVNYVSAAIEAMDLSSMKNYALMQPVTADSSGTSLYCALLSGATLHILPKEESLDGGWLADYFDEFDIDVLKILPSHFEALQAPDRISLSPRKRLILGGEMAHPRTIKAVLTAFPALRVYNHYGPTEATIGVAATELDHLDVDGGCRYLPIGRPLGNCRIYVFDEHMKLVPPGIHGELFLGGVCLAKGYESRDDLTAQAFVKNPYGSPDDRLYRTGDIGFWDVDGRIRIVGRADHQVKIRGYRVECGEIRGVLLNCPGVDECAVVIVGYDNDAQGLAAFYVSASGVATRVLEKHARAHLPDYMVPRQFIAQNRLPVISTGKIDHKALRNLIDVKPALPPSHGLEEKIMSVWRLVLGYEELKRDDNFFEVGGHSLLAAQLVSRLSHELNRQVPLRDLFEFPNVAGLSERLREQGDAGEASGVVQIEAQSRPNRIPLSYAQTRVWFMDRLTGSKCFYNMHRCWLIEGPINLDALEFAFTEVLRRHEIQRTIFFEQDGDLYQSIRPPQSFRLSVSHVKDCDDELSRQMKTELETPFDLRKDLLIRATLFACPNGTHVLLIVVHHIASDAWSMAILCRELSEFYNAFTAGRKPHQPPLTLQYADYSIWQRRWLEHSELRRQLGYWRRKLEGIERLDLPLDHRRPQEPSYRGGREKVSLSTDLSDRLRRVAADRNATLFMVLLCAFKVLLHRYTGQGDISVGTPIANRHHRDVENLIGFFSNTLVLRTWVEGGESFSTLLKRVKQTCIEAYEHQDMPFDRLVEELHPDRELGRHPLFDVTMLLHNVPDEVLALEGLSVEKKVFNAGFSNFDLMLKPIDHGDHLELVLVYRTELFDAATVSRMLKQLVRILDYLGRGHDGAISSIPILGPEERGKLFVEFSGSSTPYKQYATVMDMFESSVRRWQSAPAVLNGSRSMTYVELNENVNRLADYMMHRGIRPGDGVAVMLESGFDSVIALVAILKAGGVYVPLDSRLPASRLNTLTASVSISMLITNGGEVQQSAFIAKNHVDLAGERDTIALRSHENPARSIDSDSAAYTMFTSGSTGTPKACVNTHGGLVNLISWQTEDPRLGVPARTLQYCAQSIDASLQEILGCLKVGGSLILVGEETRRDPMLLARHIVDQNVERLFITSVALHDLLVCLQDNEGGDCLRDVVSTGDQLRITRAIRDYFRKNRRCRLHNHYGPLATHVGTAMTLDPDPSDWPELPSIGKPISNTRIFIVDRSKQFVPISARGEICIAGPGVDGTYVNEEGTSESPFTTLIVDHAAVPVYRTGDIGRYLANGNIEFLGRRGDQIKIRGYRVGLAEIEVTLLRHEAVRNATVAVFNDGPDRTPYLVAYVVLGSQCETAQLRSYLAGLLPEYMIPASFVHVDELPKNLHSKVERGALPKPDLPETRDPVTAPRNGIERRLLELWQEVLPADTIGVHDSFFDVGGDSLMAARLMLLADREFEVSLTTASLFKSPSIALLAKSIKQQRQNTGSKETDSSSALPATNSASLSKLSTTDSQFDAKESFRNPPVCTHHSLEEQILYGDLASVDAAAITYLPDRVLSIFGGDSNAARSAWCDNRVIVRRITASTMGRIASITIPMVQAELYQEPGELVSNIVAAHDLAESIGAGAISLVGVLPSTTNYGLDIANALCGRPTSLKITTGHDITSSAIVLSIKKLLRRCGRVSSRETIGFLGLGAIGARALRLMLRALPQPPRLILCDLYSKMDRLETIVQELVDLDYRGDIRVVVSHDEIPESFYSSTLIVGATNVPGILDVSKLRPGTLIVDDSAPHCFDVDAGYARLERHHDLLFTEGGQLEAPFEFDRLSYISGEIASDKQKVIQGMIPLGDKNIGGCVMSSLLVQRIHGYEAAIGEIDTSRCIQGLELLSRLDFTAAEPHCIPHFISPELVSKFVDRFGQRLD